MSASRDISQSAFVLHKRPYRETSLLVTFLTEHYGKVNAVVRGVRAASKTAKLKQAWLQPFQGLNIHWREKPNAQSDLIALREIEPTRIRFPLMGEASVCGLYINELSYRLIYPSLVSESLFQTYQQTLFDLAKAESRNHQAWCLRQFEFQLMTEMGYGIEMLVDANQKALTEDETYLCHQELGWVPETETVFDSGVKVRGKCLLKFSRQEYCEDCLADLKRLFRFLLVPYLGDKPIQARMLFQNLNTRKPS